MNMLPGAVKDGRFVADDLTLDLSGYDGGALIDRPKAILGLRPEHLMIVGAAEAGRTIPAVVEIDEPMGADSLIWLVAAGMQMSVRVPVEKRLEAGTHVHLKVDVAKASLFDVGTEQRV
jgi:multiple sugar transport system ATP-binding protein